MLKNFRRRGLVVLIFFVLLFMQACGGGAAEPEPGSDEHIKLTVAIRQNMSFAPLYIAQEEGYFADQGLEIEFIAATRSGEAIAALLLGELDVFPSSMVIAVFNAMAQGEPIKMVANKGYFDPDGCTYFALALRKDLFDSGEITNVADLEGRRVSIRTDNFSAFIVDTALKPAGINVSDFEILEIPSASEFSAMEDQVVDAVFVIAPYVIPYEDTDLGVILVRGELELPNTSFGYVIFGPSILEDNPEAGKRFLVAYMQGVRQYNEGHTDRNLDILVKATEQDRDLLDQACWPSITNDGQQDLQGMLDFQAWANEKGLLDTIATEEQMWDSSFVDYANETLP